MEPNRGTEYRMEAQACSRSSHQKSRILFATLGYTLSCSNRILSSSGCSLRKIALKRLGPMLLQPNLSVLTCFLLNLVISICVTWVYCECTPQLNTTFLCSRYPNELELEVAFSEVCYPNKNWDQTRQVCGSG